MKGENMDTTVRRLVKGQQVRVLADKYAGAVGTVVFDLPENDFCVVEIEQGLQLAFQGKELEFYVPVKNNSTEGRWSRVDTLNTVIESHKVILDKNIVEKKNVKTPFSQLIQKVRLNALRR